MATVRAIYENGIFRPTEPVDLPPSCEVEFEPRLVNGVTAPPGPLDAIYQTLNERFESGVRDTAERHDEHQP